MQIFFLIVLFVCLLFVFLVNGRRGQRGLDVLRGWCYAHRGLYGDSVPENSMSAFRAAKDAGYGIELDVHLLMDGNLAVIHDSSLMRTVGCDVQIESLSAEALGRYKLLGSQEKIPLFRDVLDLFAGSAPMIVELKCVNNNHAALCSAVCRMLDGYNGAYCLESFDPRCVYWLRKNRPDIIRGQLTENFFKSSTPMPWILKFAMRHQLLNVFSRPDFVAYRFCDRKTISNFIARSVWGIQGVSWTIKNADDLETALKEDWIPIFEDFLP